MKKYLAIIVLAASLGGCAQLQNFFSGVGAAVGIVTGAQVTDDQAYIAANAYDALAKTGIVYLQLPLCSATQSKVCRTQAASQSVYNALLIGRTARNNLLAALNSGGGVSISLYTALENQVSTLQQIEATYNIGG